MKYYTMEKRKISSGGKKMDLYILRPTVNAKRKEKTPGILWIHGGGYITGMAKMIYISRAMALVKKYGAVVVTPEYRLSKEAPYPAALEDCYASLRYLKEHAEELGINSSQIMVGGESAGGGLAVATCMYARDRGEIRISYQMPLYPMLDDRDTESTAREIEKVIRRVDEKLRAQRTVQEATQKQEAGIAQEQTPWNESKENVTAGVGKAGDIYPAALAPVLGAGMETAGCRTLDCRMLRWGLPGYPPKGNGKKGQVIFNARSETAMEKPTFREGIKNHRIVIPAAGFYEWNRKKEKYRFRRTDSPVLFMAGCFRCYEDGDRFVILTTAANASMEPVHDRMPLILEPDEIADWIWDGERTKHLLEKRPCLLERTTDYEQMTLF